MKSLPLLAGLIVASLGFCASDKLDRADVTAVVIDGFCVQNRSARAPVAYYSTETGRAQLQDYLKKAGDEMPVFQLASERLAGIRAIAFSADNKVESGKVNFFVRFFDDRGETGSRALSRAKLKEVIDSLPETARANLMNMCERG